MILVSYAFQILQGFEKHKTSHYILLVKTEGFKSIQKPRSAFLFCKDFNKQKIMKAYSTYNLSIVSNSNLISFQTSQAEANSGLHLQAARIMSPPSRARSRPSLRA